MKLDNAVKAEVLNRTSNEQYNSISLNKFSCNFNNRNVHSKQPMVQMKKTERFASLLSICGCFVSGFATQVGLKSRF